MADSSSSPSSLRSSPESTAADHDEPAVQTADGHAPLKQESPSTLILLEAPTHSHAHPPSLSIHRHGADSSGGAALTILLKLIDALRELVSGDAVDVVTLKAAIQVATDEVSSAHIDGTASSASFKRRFTAISDADGADGVDGVDGDDGVDSDRSSDGAESHRDGDAHTGRRQRQFQRRRGGVMNDSDDEERSAHSKDIPSLIMSCSRHPVEIFHVPVQKQYTMTLRATKNISIAAREELVRVSVRVMGTENKEHVYFVAKDVCQLICLRKGSVAKATHDFTEQEKARMPVMCPRGSSNGCVQVFTVLTLDGVKRLMASSRQPIAKRVLEWLLLQCKRIREDKSIHIDSFPVMSSSINPDAADTLTAVSNIGSIGSIEEISDDERNAVVAVSKTSSSTAPPIRTSQRQRNATVQLSSPPPIITSSSSPSVPALSGRLLTANDLSSASTLLPSPTSLLMPSPSPPPQPLPLPPPPLLHAQSGLTTYTSQLIPPSSLHATAVTIASPPSSHVSLQPSFAQPITHYMNAAAPVVSYHPMIYQLSGQQPITPTFAHQRLQSKINVAPLTPINQQTMPIAAQVASAFHIPTIPQNVSQQLTNNFNAANMSLTNNQHAMMNAHLQQQQQQQLHMMHTAQQMQTYANFDANTTIGTILGNNNATQFTQKYR